MKFKNEAMPKAVYDRWTLERQTTPTYNQLAASVEVLECLARVFLKELVKSSQNPTALVKEVRDEVRMYLADTTADAEQRRKHFLEDYVLYFVRDDLLESEDPKIKKLFRRQT